MTKNRYLERESPEGAMLVWEQPIAGAQYVVSADCAGGGAKSDFAVSLALNCQTQNVAAIIRKREDPIAFGVRCARFAAKYNDALLVFETYPSGHGLMACQSAKDDGYPNLYRQQRQNTAALEPTANLGWHTDDRAKRAMRDRVFKALSDWNEINSLDLLAELDTREWRGKPDEPADTWKIGGRGHDDAYVAYAIALLVRDQTWSETARVAAPPTAPFKERFWEWRKERMSQWGQPKKVPAYAGL